MDTSQHDESADTDSSRPADPRSGKTTPERSPENQQQRQSSDEEDERLASDVLLGVKRIAEHLAAILGVPIDENDIYYAHRMEKLPIGKYGAQLIGSRHRLNCHVEQIARGHCHLTGSGARGFKDQQANLRAPAPSPVKGAPGSSRKVAVVERPLYRAPEPRRQQDAGTARLAGAP